MHVRSACVGFVSDNLVEMHGINNVKIKHVLVESTQKP
jgi:hypothetical protein